MKSTPALFVLVLLVVAIALVLAFQGGDDGVPPASIDTPSADVSAPAGPDHGATGTASAESGSEAAKGSAENGRVEVESAGGRGADAAGGGEAYIVGRLVDSKGQPKADAELSYRSWGNPDGVDFFFPDDQDERPSTKLTVGPDGSFSFQLGRSRTAMLSLSSTDVRFAEHVSPIHGRRGDQDLGELVVVHSAVLSGVVQDERGAPVAGVIVTSFSGLVGFSGISRATTGDDGRFRLGKLGPGLWTLRTASAQFMPALHEVTVQEAEEVDDIVLVVKQGRGIAGQVIDDLGRPVADVRVGAKRSEARGGVDIERFSDDEATTTDDNGMFALFGLEGETATVRTFGGRHTSAIAPDVRVGTGNLVLRVERPGTVIGTLVRTDGSPIGGSRVYAVAQERGGELGLHGIDRLLPNRRQSGETAPDGTFRLENVSPGDVTISAEGDTHLRVERSGLIVRPGRVTEGVRLVAASGATAVVTVLDEKGNPVEGAEVRAAPPARNGAFNGGMLAERIEADGGDLRVFGGGGALGSAETDAEGRAVIRGLPAKTLAFSASHAEYADSAPVALPLLANGTIDVELTLRVPGWVDLMVTQAGTNAPVEGAKFVVRSSDQGSGDRQDGKTDAEGKSLVGPLAPGSYTAELQRTNEGMNVGGAMILLGGMDPVIEGSRKKFVVAAGKTAAVTLVRPVLTRVFGTVTGADGPVAGCNVEIQKSEAGQPAIPGMGGGRSITTAADGTFAIDDVEPGDYVVEYGRIEQIVKAEVKLSVVPGAPEHRLDLALRTGKVRVQAWSATTGGPLAGAEVELSRQTGEEGEPRERQMVMFSVVSTGGDEADSTMMTFGAQRAKTGADGWAEIDDVPVGDYQLKVTHDKHSPATERGLVVTELQTTEVGRVALSQAGSIRGKVQNADGTQAQMGLVFHRPVGGEDGQPAVAMGGTFEIEALPPGRYALRARAIEIGGSSGGGASESGPEVEVDVLGGETATVELRLPAN